MLKIMNNLMVAAGGLCLGGLSVKGGDLAPPRGRMTDRCKNITFPQLRLQAVTTIINEHLENSFNEY